MKKVTVKELIESLQKFPEDANVEIAISQFNKVHPVAYCKPEKTSIYGGYIFANMKNGKDVRIEVTLPYDEETFMTTSKRKIR